MNMRIPTQSQTKAPSRTTVDAAEQPKPAVPGNTSRGARSAPQISSMDPSLPSAAGQISTQAPVKGSSPLDVRLSAADKRAGKIAELDRAALAPLALGVASETALLKMADKVSKALDQGSWRSLLRFADPENKSIQMKEMKIGAAQYVAELLGLHTVGNTLTPKGETLSDEHMGRITDVSLSQAEWFSQPSGIVTLRGEALVGEGKRKKKLKVELMVDLSNPDKPVLTGGVG